MSNFKFVEFLSPGNNIWLYELILWVNLFFDVNRDGEDFDFLMKLKSLTNNWVITPEVFYNVRH